MGDVKQTITVDDAHNPQSWNSTGISASSSEHDNHETSSDYSNSEDETENAVPVS
jgi:hypothetical protein